ncbi:winged helix-turn-helix domain-containing protein [Paenibacillus sedimenti]|uniref:Helix-turn-helix transcriptional regulator n=1 Tax=Paenibacillus sedimenti TaxID=2770274 RepID=A0A926QHJ3_9BACL|nr:winged helix-turn-helix domain-containing protein [Paenibacillus sedimenti]MBD0379616.1 helix-turn-helix transcriptional regulator [Paenibacillus sedimenti]
MENQSNQTESIPKITPEQSKLLQSALRIKILHALAKEAKTAKQAAVQLQQTPGNIHYHIQKLHDGGFLEIVKTQTVRGVVEKYYQSLGTAFKTDARSEIEFIPGERPSHLSTSLLLSDSELEQFREELNQLLSRWESHQSTGAEYGISIKIGRISV